MSRRPQVTVVLSSLLLASALAARAAGPPPWEAAEPLSVPSAEIRAAAAAVPAEAKAKVLVLFEGVTWTLDERGRTLFRQRLAYRIEQEGAGWDEVSAWWSPWYQQRPEIRARVITADGTEKVLDPATIGEFSAENDRSVYSDRKRLRAPLPSVGKGAIVQYELVVRDTEPFFAAGHKSGLGIGFGSNPVLHTVYEIDAPESRPLRAFVRGGAARPPVETVTDGRRRLVVERDRLEALEDPERNLPRDVRTRESLLFSTGRSWAEVAAAYAALVEPRLGDPRLPPDVRDALRGLSTRDQKIARLVARLHAKVRYTGIEFDEAALVPRRPDETLARGYGDCKDKSVLLASWLRAAGFDARLALVQAGGRGDVDPDLPGLGEFDHAIVYLPGTPPAWIDATAEFTPLPHLPPSVQGRRALVIAPGTKVLVTTPEARAADNTLLQTREVFLAENGAARIVETSGGTGFFEANLRSSYADEDEEALRRKAESVAKDDLGGKELGAHSITPPAERETPFTVRVEALESTKALTSRSDAAVWINWWPLLARVRDLIGYEHRDKPEKPRRSDLYTPEPHRAVWRYVITPPPGFRSTGLPAAGDTKVGPAVLRRAVEVRPDGVVVATITVECDQRRWSPAEAEAAWSALYALGQTKPDAITFEQTGEAHLAAGRLDEAVAEFRGLCRAAPGKASPHARLSRAMLEVGLGEAARAEARQAIAIDPEQALGHQALGWALQHDLIGRRFGRGFDPDGAVAAYRKARELDPDDAITRADLAILLEHVPAGRRYGPGAKLDEAVLEYAALEKDLGNKNFRVNRVLDLMHAGRYAEARALAESMDASDARNGWILAAAAAQDGAAAAIAEAPRVVANPVERGNALRSGADVLVGLRLYEAAAAFLSEGAKGAPDPVAVRARADVLGRTRRHETIPATREPAQALVDMFTVLMTRGEDEAAIRAVFAPSVQPVLGSPEAMRDLVDALRAGLAKNPDTPPDVLLDVTLAFARFATDGSAERGFRVRVMTAGAGADAAQTAFVVGTPGAYRIAGFLSEPATVAGEILARADAGDLASARQLLDWLREDIAPAGGDDPLAPPYFPAFWTRGQQGGVEQVRTAAAVLLATLVDDPRPLPLLEAARSAAASDAERERLDLPLAAALSGQHRDKDLETVVRRLLARAPDSDLGLNVLVGALSRQKRWDEARAAIDERLARRADDRAALALRANLAMLRADWAEADRLHEDLVARGLAGPGEYNNLAWSRMVQGRSDDRTIELARQAVRLDDRWSVKHTLAAVLADAGRPREAYEVLSDEMNDRGALDPEPEEWFVIGRIAESFGERDAARTYYGRVTARPEREDHAGSTWALAQKRLAALEAPPAAPPAAKGKKAAR